MFFLCSSLISNRCTDTVQFTVKLLSDLQDLFNQQQYEEEKKLNETKQIVFVPFFCSLILALHSIKPCMSHIAVFFNCVTSLLNYFAILLFRKLIKLPFIAFTVITTHVHERAPWNYLVIRSHRCNIWCLSSDSFLCTSYSLRRYLCHRISQSDVLKNSSATFDKKIKLIFQSLSALQSMSSECNISIVCTSWFLHLYSSSFLSANFRFIVLSLVEFLFLFLKVHWKTIDSLVIFLFVCYIHSFTH